MAEMEREGDRRFSYEILELSARASEAVIAGELLRGRRESMIATPAGLDLVAEGEREQADA